MFVNLEVAIQKIIRYQKYNVNNNSKNTGLPEIKVTNSIFNESLSITNINYK